MSAALAEAVAIEPGRTRYGMVFDMDACVGCQTCTIACKQTNQTTPGILWRNVLDLEVGKFPAVERSFLLTGCQHCDEPPCVPVCPTGATWKRDDGLVVIDYDTCIGCSSCVVSCPYQARTLDKDPPTYYGGAPMPTERTAQQGERDGVAQKCTFCKDRIDDGLARGLVPGVDPDATPACANACISQAITFGNLADPADRAARLLADAGGRQMHAELGTNPHIFYIGERRENISTPGPVQRSWDIRAAMNFIAGGAAAGLMLAAFFAWALAGLPTAWLAGVNLGAGALMAFGLFCVFLKLGRKARFWRVLTRWQTSWMTRETYCVALIYAAMAAMLARPHAVALVALAIGAAGFLVSQAKILHTARGIPAWRSPRVPPLLVLTALFEGAGLLFLVLTALPAPGMGGRMAAAVAAVAGLMLAIIWPRFVAEVEPDTKGELNIGARRVSLVGQWLAAAVFAVYALVPGSQLVAAAAAIAGLAAVAQGAFWKYRLIVVAAHFQGLRIPARAGHAHRRSPAVAAAQL
ncbi:MAG: dimethyl sulfoxide reductase anchor subunit [Burkholderiales bacterium]|nr:dimethyl sulfoxide reductase anchor subunit [Burkholderiales bacterium]